MGEIKYAGLMYYQRNLKIAYTKNMIWELTAKKQGFAFEDFGFDIPGLAVRQISENEDSSLAGTSTYLNNIYKFNYPNTRRKIFNTHK